MAHFLRHISDILGSNLWISNLQNLLLDQKPGMREKLPQSENPKSNLKIIRISNNVSRSEGQTPIPVLRLGCVVKSGENR